MSKLLKLQADSLLFAAVLLVQPIQIEDSEGRPGLPDWGFKARNSHVPGLVCGSDNSSNDTQQKELIATYMNQLSIAACTTSYNQYSTPDYEIHGITGT